MLPELKQLTMKNKLLLSTKRMLTLTLAFYLTSMLAASQTIKGSWKSISDMPTARWFPATTVYNGKIYVIGGNASPTSPSLNVNEVYDPATDTWKTKAPIPIPRSQLSAVTYDGKIYVIGGSSGPTGWIPVPNVDIYDPSANTWSTGANMPAPRTEMSLVTVKDKIYAIGGIDGTSTGSKSVDIYDPVANTWSKGANMPTSRGTMPACELDGKIYVFGGSNGGASSWNHFSMLEVYDVESDTWSTKAEMPWSRSHNSGCVLNNKIFAIGGTQINLNLSYATMASYNPLTDTWENEPPMINAREAFNAVVADGKIYALGGTIYPGLIAFPNSEVYDTLPKVVISNFELLLPANTADFIGKLFVPNSGDMSFTFTKDEVLYDGALFELRNDSVFTAQNFELDANSEYQFEILAVSQNDDSVRTVIKLKAISMVKAVYTAPNGFVLESSDKKVMIDVLASKTPGYGFVANSNEIFENMKNAVEPFNNVDLIYTSHDHACHFDAELLLNAMLNNPGAISVMGVDVKSAMQQYFAANPGIEDRIFAPLIPAKSFIDTTLAGIKIRLTNIVHEGANSLSINFVLDSIHFVHFDDYNNLTESDYNTIGFTQLPTDVALLGALLLNGEQNIIKNTFNNSGHITISHIAFIADRFSDYVNKVKKLEALDYKINMPRWPMEMFAYKKSDGQISISTLNSAPILNKTYADLTVKTGGIKRVSIPLTAFKDTDPGDALNYRMTINNMPLPDWADFDTVSRVLELIPTEAKTYTVTITATDNHLSFSNTSFKLMVSNPVGIENLDNKTEFKVYPNPAQSIINIESPGEQNGSYSVDLYNMLGEKIYSVNENQNNKISIDLSEFSEAVMFLIITSNGNTKCHKIVRY